MAYANLPQTAQQSHNPTGRHFVPGGGLTYGEQVRPDDLVDVDFDQRQLSVDGLYVVEHLSESGDTKGISCRRFDFSIGGFWRVDTTGGGTWHQLDGTEPIRIAGRVCKVYRPV